jgi:hypothetical protein
VTFDFTTIDWRVVLAALAIIVAVILAFYFQWWRNQKRLSYDVLSNFELVSSKKIRDKVEIRYEGKPVESVHLVVVKLINDGFQPIRKDEFEQPIRLIFRSGSVLSAEREKFQPENIGTEISYQDGWVEITPTLFNRKDYIQFKILLDGFSKMEIDARIVGVSNITQAGELLKAYRWLLVFCLLIGATAIFIGVSFLFSTDEIPFWLRLLIVILGVGGVGPLAGFLLAKIESIGK